jgi:thymidylate synthase (FAD)
MNANKVEEKNKEFNIRNEQKIVLTPTPKVELEEVEGNFEKLRELMKGKTHGGSPQAWLDLGFTVPLEFIGVTYKVHCSRVASHQIVRHRIGTSFIQHSGRFGSYAQVGDENNYTFIIPNSLLNSDKEKEKIDSAISNAVETYESLLKDGASLEEARRVLPESIQTYLIIKFNLRSLGSFLRQRLCSMAQPEIRYIAIEMLYQLHFALKKNNFSEEDIKGIYRYMFPPCVITNHCLNNKEVKNQNCLIEGLQRAIEEHGGRRLDRRLRLHFIDELLGYTKSSEANTKQKTKMDNE